MTWENEFAVWAARPDLPEELATELAALREDPEQAKDAFYQPLSFGTAGMRGLMGVGINRMNIYTVRQATAGLAHLMTQQGQAAMDQGVVIAHDSRRNSSAFALEAAMVLGAAGIKTYLFDHLRPTPELSFAVRELGAYAGIMLTASHNPKAYNGYKLYGADGGQMPPAEADVITQAIREVDRFAVPVADAETLKASGHLAMVGDAIDAAYLAAMQSVTVDRELTARQGQDMKLVYSPLHGTGALLAVPALEQIGFKQVLVVPEQAEPNGDFPTVELPNPEDTEALAMGIALAKQEAADVVIAVDPDADRMGVAVRQPSGDYQLLTGNQIAAVMLDYLLAAKQASATLPANGAVVKSIVSSEFATAVANSYDVAMQNVLTGFKYIAEKIEQFEQTSANSFLFGFEESYGYLVKAFARDKDSIQATVLFAEVAAYYREKGMTVYDGLQALYAKHGYFIENTDAMTFAGADGADKIKQLIAAFRNETPADFGGIEVVAVEDFREQVKTTVATQATTAITLPKADVLKYWLADGSWIAVRPSGTEPKIKFYVGTKGADQATAQANLTAIRATIQTIIATV